MVNKQQWRLMFLSGIVGGVIGGCVSWMAAAYAQSTLLGSYLSIVGADNKQRIQAAVYTAPSESGLPLVGLYDNQQDLRLLLRLAGSNSSPVIVMKDRQHRDRVVLGLELNDKDQEPFLATFDKNGNKRMIFGNY